MSEYSAPFLLSILDTVNDQIAVIETNGEIIFVNESWRAFSGRNEMQDGIDWLGTNYIDATKTAADNGDEDAKRLIVAFEHLRTGMLDDYYYEYPCHSPEEQRWFLMSAKKLEVEGRDVFVISHKNITERRLAEEKAHNLSRKDWLTGLDNRRAFDEQFDKEWRRSIRLSQPISIAMIDIDHFKLLNDHYGHSRGDDCLCLVSNIINRFSKRPGDISARYGGEEFIIALGNTDLSEAEAIIHKIMQKLDEEEIEHNYSPIKPIITVSIGVASIVPSKDDVMTSLIAKADELLYQSKASGRDRMTSAAI